MPITVISLLMHKSTCSYLIPKLFCQLLIYLLPIIDTQPHATTVMPKVKVKWNTGTHLHNPKLIWPKKQMTPITAFGWQARKSKEVKSTSSQLCNSKNNSPTLDSHPYATTTMPKVKTNDLYCQNKSLSTQSQFGQKNKWSLQWPIARLYYTATLKSSLLVPNYVIPKIYREQSILNYMLLQPYFTSGPTA